MSACMRLVLGLGLRLGCTILGDRCPARSNGGFPSNDVFSAVKFQGVLPW